MQWTVLIPAKALPAAKSRLAPASGDAAAHRRLVEAIRADTVSAALRAAGVARVVLVVDRPDGPSAAVPEALMIVQRTAGLNAAVSDGAAHAARHWPGDGVAALVGDLPALRPDELADALVSAGEHGLAFVPDADGTGTTLLAAAPGRTLHPAFGARSAARHATGATALPGGDGLRRDVDTKADLELALALGVGPATAAELATVSWTSGVAVVDRSPCGGIVGP